MQVPLIPSHAAALARGPNVPPVSPPHVPITPPAFPLCVLEKPPASRARAASTAVPVPAPVH